MSDKEEFTVKPTMNWAGANASIVKDFSAVCFLTVRETLRIHGLPNSTPVGLVQSAVGGTRIEAWMPKEAFGSCSAFPVPKNTKGDEAPSALFNGMIAPFQFMAVRAALWYQGEGQPASRGISLASVWHQLLFRVHPILCTCQQAVDTARSFRCFLTNRFLVFFLLPPLSPPPRTLCSQCRPTFRAVRRRRLAHPSVRMQTAGNDCCVARTERDGRLCLLERAAAALHNSAGFHQADREASNPGCCGTCSLAPRRADGHCRDGQWCKGTLPTENLREDTDGLLCPPSISGLLMRQPAAFALC